MAESFVALLPSESTATGFTGVASTADFLLHKVPPLIDLLASDYEAATLDVPGVRQVSRLTGLSRIAG